jgi:streptogramin lyase
VLNFAVVPFLLVLSGCAGVSGIPSTETATNPGTGTALRGIVHGGQQAIVGAHVYLYAANTNGYNGSSISLLTSGTGRTLDGNGNYYVTTQSGGAFNISNEYTCPTLSSQVYLYSIGGNPGLGDGANSAAGLMAALGTCGTLSSTQTVIVNEVSTIATAYAIAGFATDATHVSTSSTALGATGLADAFAAAANLESLSTGLAIATTPAGNGTVPVSEIYTLADILAACINSSGPTSTGCSTLFTNAKNGTTAPSETATAAINIAHNPESNLTALYGLATATSPFQPMLGGVPNDFTVSITYSGGGMDGSGYTPEGIAIDGSGNVWLTNFNSNTVSEFKYDGTPLSPNSGTCSNHYCSAGLNQPTSVAIDIYGNAWVANFQADTIGVLTDWSISEFNSSGLGISGPPGYLGSGLDQPYGIAIDSTGHAWIANFGGNDLSEFTSSGTPLSGANGYTGDAIVEPAGIAADTLGNVWAVDYGAAISVLVETDSTGAQTADPDGYQGGGLNAPYGIAIDSAANVWVTNQSGGTDGTGSLSEFDSSGNALSGANGFSGGGLDVPYGLAVDGAGNVWVANRYSSVYNGSISEFNSSGAAISPSTGYGSNLNFAYGIAIDPSGNVWVATQNNNSSLTEFVGGAAPVVTPLAAGEEYKQLGAKP